MHICIYYVFPSVCTYVSHIYNYVIIIYYDVYNLFLNRNVIIRNNDLAYSTYNQLIPFPKTETSQSVNTPTLSTIVIVNEEPWA